MRAMEYEPVQCQCEPMGRWTLVRWCPIHGKHPEPTKKLTDAECAAELWREHALWTEAFMGRESPDPEVAAHSRSELPVVRHRSDTWHRFATHPHASEVDQ